MPSKKTNPDFQMAMQINGLREEKDLDADTISKLREENRLLKAHNAMLERSVVKLQVLLGQKNAIMDALLVATLPVQPQNHG